MSGVTSMETTEGPACLARARNPLERLLAVAIAACASGGKELPTPDGRPSADAADEEASRKAATDDLIVAVMK
jgi:hypothetical protein